MNTFEVILQSLFVRQARDVLNRLKIEELVLGRVPDLRHWVKPVADVSRSELRTYYAAGQMDYWRVKARRKSIDPLSRRHVLDAVDSLALQFSISTLETATGQLKLVLRNLRKILREGIERGQDAQTTIANEVLRCFADPVRAKRIAVTETHRARCLGYLGAATESGDTRKRWAATADACKACRQLHGKTVSIDLPFASLPGGGPYAVVLTPPLHPNCTCNLETL